MAPRRAPTRCTCGCAARQTPNLLFILGTGRSGSTSLMWALNALPGVHISGENDGVANLLVQFSEAAVKTQRLAHLTAWTNSLDAPRLQCSLVRLLLRVINAPPTARVAGFKTIRLVEHAERFAALLPCARFVVNVRRDVRRQSRSSFYRLRSHAAEAAQLANRTQALLDFAARQPASRRVVRTEELSVRGLQALLRWLAPLEREASAPIGPPTAHRFDASAHSPCPTFFDRANRRAIPPADPCARCPWAASRAEDLAAGAARPYGGCTVLRAPRVDGVMTRDELARSMPDDAQHRGIVACAPFNSSTVFFS